MLAGKLSWFLLLAFFVVIVQSGCPGVRSNPKVPCEDELPEICRQGPEVYCATKERIRTCYKFEKCQNYRMQIAAARFYNN